MNWKSYIPMFLVFFGGVAVVKVSSFLWRCHTRLKRGIY